LKNIIIAGPQRSGKSTLAEKINVELNYFIIGLDKLVATFGSAYPQLDIRLNWDYDKTRANLAPFIGHFLGMFASPDGRGLLPYSHGAVKGNRFALEGAYFDFEKMLPVLKAYGINELKGNFILIGLVQNKKTADDFMDDFKTYDTKDDWTYGFNDDDLKWLSQEMVKENRFMSDYLTQFGFTIYDTSTERERVFDRIIEDINANQTTPHF